MKHTQKTTRVVASLALALILVGCNSPTVVVPPTQDIPSIRTESAQTVVAKLTIDAALNTTPAPEATQTPAVITATTAPSPTAAPATATSSAAVATATTVVYVQPTAAPQLYPTFTPRSGPDQAQFISQTPTDGTVFNPSNSFDAVWTFKNIGTSTWNTNYFIRVAPKGTKMSPQNRYFIHSPVKPGQTVQLIADMKAPTTQGRYVSYWELCNDNGDIFFNFYMVIDVKAP